MITKNEFFAMLNDKENRVNSTARVALMEDSKGNISVIVKQDSAPNFGMTNHRKAEKAEAAFAKFSEWLNEWFAVKNAEVEAVEAEEDNTASFVIKGEGSFESELVAAKSSEETRMPIPTKKGVTLEIKVDVSKYMKEMLILTVGVYPNGDVHTFKRNTVSAANFETHVRYNATYRPGRALFAKFPDGTVMCLLEGACSQEQLERASKEIYHMSIGTEDSAPYH